MLDSITVLTAARDTAAVFCFRVPPVLFFALLTRRLGVTPKVLIALAGAALAAVAYTTRLIEFGWLAAAYAYFVIGGCAVPSATHALRSGRLTAGAVFVASASVFFVIPALLWPQAAKIMALVLGWDLMLSSYSYSVEVSKAKEPPRLGDCLFFLLVNPALVYVRRGAQVSKPAIHVAALGRCLLGLSSLFAVSALLSPIHTFVQSHGAESDLNLSKRLVMLGIGGALRFLIEYWRQSGVANLQMGMLRQLGYAVPERFTAPLRAKDLPDFWRRWNTYVGQWLLRYVFLPVTLKVGRNTKVYGLRHLAMVAGVLVTFGSVGVLHDVYAYGLSFHVVTAMSQAFLVNGALVLLSAGVQRFWIAAESRAPLPGWLVTTGALARRSSFWLATIVTFTCWWR